MLRTSQGVEALLASKYPARQELRCPEDHHLASLFEVGDSRYLATPARKVSWRFLMGARVSGAYTQDANAVDLSRHPRSLITGCRCRTWVVLPRRDRFGNLHPFHATTSFIALEAASFEEREEARGDLQVMLASSLEGSPQRNRMTRVVRGFNKDFGHIPARAGVGPRDVIATLLAAGANALGFASVTEWRAAR